MIALTKVQLNIFQTALGLLGLVFGWLATNSASLPPQYQIFASIGGLAGGYLVADAVSYLNTGSISTTVVEGQAKAVWSAGLREQIVAKINSTVTDPTQKVIALAVVAEIDQQLAIVHSPLEAAVAPK